METILSWIAGNWVVTLIGISCIIEIVPIKINPWSRILKWIGKLMNKDLIDDIKQIKNDNEEQKNMIIANEKDRIRWEVLDFANSLRNGRKHTLDEFKHIVTLNEKYKELLALTNDTNGVFDLEYDYIVSMYQECQRNNSFLK